MPGFVLTRLTTGLNSYTMKQLSFYVLCGMEGPRNRYILLQDRVAEIMETSMLTLGEVLPPFLDLVGLCAKSAPTQVLKGKLLEALLLIFLASSK